MILIRAALFAVFAFMGTISLSAQNGWLPPAAAVVVITDELNKLNQPPTPSGNTLTTKQALLEANTKIGCSDCFLKSVKREFLERTMLKLKLGATDTGVAVSEVRAEFIQNANNNPTVLATIQTAYEFMQDKL